MDSANILAYYTSQSSTTDPGKYVDLYEGIPADVPQIVDIVQGVLLSLDQVGSGPISISGERINKEIHLTSVKEMLQCISNTDERPLIFTRPIEERMVGICAQHAMLTCSILRDKGIPARTRGGFAMYFTGNRHHDHWICEYWNTSEERWVQVDSELNDVVKERLNITFNTSDLPPDKFITGAEIWEACRAGKENPSHFGVMGDEWAGGWDFVLCEMVLDFLALNKIERLPWDENRLSRKGITRLTDDECALLDKASELVIAGNDSFEAMRLLYHNHKKLQE